MIWEELEQELDRLQRDGLQRRRRTLEGPCGPLARVDGRTLISFCSNDYLGLSAHPALIEAACTGARAWGVGSGASHLVSGHLTPHAELEAKLADFVGFPRALLFSTGYMANLGIVPALLGRADAVFADRLNHASLIDAAQLARADHQRYPHCDLAALERLLANSQAKRKLILTDAVFSMDGDLAPLPGLLALAERYDAWLVVDDAHGFGVLGPRGRGSLAHFALPAARRLLYMGTLGKAAGAAGAFVAGDERVIAWLMQRARTYIFTTAASPLIAVALSASLDLIARGDALRQHLWRLTAQLRDGLAGTRWRLLPSASAIQPVVVGDNQTTVALADALYERGLWVPAIRPPTVPPGTARLRISLSAAHSSEQVGLLVDNLRDLACG
ncbi:8-amino-7-oxononanoate synthase [Accumulibacter sp.]|uniref:8-amino-7-oxononanoate synthase n=1 Tax=Accumulibacter sp. TaxID=2053492 RepID=UPI002639914B|nr:8-amino-7-oxononanoate synthase [Accumulibacter sp.]HMW79816.1 8-amino-7-oxononanoate synthase [Accumulibacter sp.]HNE39780.1 8-amino-7-oxononanoate synthase [Accumulibacter sp.]HNG15696.1 8-amino-7-oxononanoate synthase [Accumulibacter sp.]HNG86934.1 8-amino-7-oxononanoate synthase [Accumulibacter sp.]HNM63338.1 8-amino-7-oxononanoate synthase [Accumulibacter sp.]